MHLPMAPRGLYRFVLSSSCTPIHSLLNAVTLSDCFYICKLATRNLAKLRLCLNFMSINLTGMSALETSAGRQMCSLTHPSTVKNFPHPHSPLSNFSLTHTHPAQSFPSPALIPRNHHTFPQFPANFFICRPIYFRLLHSLSNIIC